MKLGTRRAFSKLKNFLTQKKRSPMARPIRPSRPVVMTALLDSPSFGKGELTFPIEAPVPTAAELATMYPGAVAKKLKSLRRQDLYREPSSAEITALYAQPQTGYVQRTARALSALGKGVIAMSGYQFPPQTARKSLA